MNLRPAVSLLTLLYIAACTVSQDQEAQIGQDEAAKINAQLPLLRNAAIDDYVNTLGTSIASRTSRADLKWQFAVVNTDVVNAFALPGGFIYVNRGLIARTRNESELAGVMSHEIEHVVRRHSVQQMEKAQGANVGVAVVCRLTSICAHAAGQVAIQVGAAAMFARFSRTDEIQADSGGFQNEMRAGLDPRGMLTFFERLLADEQRQHGIVLPWFADHPGTQDRVAEVQRMLARLPPGVENGLRTDSPEFQAMQRQLASLPAAPAPARPTPAGSPNR
jgi:beta-barrel assembly-enhancing protease